MKICSYTCWVTALLLLLLAALAAAFAWFAYAAPPGPPPEADATTPPGALRPARYLRIHVRESQAPAATLLDATAVIWKETPATAISLHRTPRIYQTEPVQDRPAPACTAAALRADGKLYMHLQWDDATRNAPEAPPSKTGTGGAPPQLYKRPTGDTAAFADAAAVMVPDHWEGPSFPSLLMGDKHAPTSLYYWNASRGAELLAASGRATPQPTGRKVTHQARHDPGRWAVVFELPDLPSGYPVAFATWDGAFSDRDGLKFFSIWYVLLRD